MNTLFPQQKEGPNTTKDETDDLFAPVCGHGYAYQVVRLDTNFMYTVATMQIDDSFINIVIKKDLHETDKNDTIFISSLSNETVH